MASANAKNPKVSAVDDDDLDDLDDVLDQFTPGAPPPATGKGISSASGAIPTVPASSFPPPSASSPSPHTSTFPPAASVPPNHEPDAEGEDDDDDDFAKELQRGMEALMRELVPGPPLGGASAAGSASGTGVAGKGTEGEIKAQERAFKAAWEAMLVEGMDGMVPPGPAGETFAGSSSAGAKKEAGKKDFQAGIRATMDKLKESESALKDSTAGASGSSDPFEALMSQLSSSLGVEGGEGENEEELAGMLEAMMGSLMSKEVLYEPLKELGDKFPDYLSTHPDLPAPERARYNAQFDAIRKILAVFEAPGYTDDDQSAAGKKGREEVVRLMSEMQAHGSPPAEIMGELPPGFNLPGMGGEGGEGMPEGCCIC